jgi:hypothetical protein
LKQLVQSGKWLETSAGKAAIDTYIPAAKAAMESTMRTGQDLSLVYMALISNTDVYQDVLEHGGTSFEAASIALGSTVGMFGVDKYLGLGEMFFDSNEVRTSFRNGWRKEANDIVKSLNPGQTPTTKKEARNKFFGLMNTASEKASKFVNDYHTAIKDRTLGFFGKSIGEGLEEVSEELVTDISKNIGEVLGTMGVFSKDDYGAWDNAFDRYMMSFLGGAVGGGLFYGVEEFQNRNIPKKKNGEDDIIYLIRNHKKEELFKELDTLHKKG